MKLFAIIVVFVVIATPIATGQTDPNLKVYQEGLKAYRDSLPKYGGTALEREVFNKKWIRRLGNISLLKEYKRALAEQENLENVLSPQDNRTILSEGG